MPDDIKGGIHDPIKNTGDDWGDRQIDALDVPIGDSVKSTTCYMCACRCGINVHSKDGKIRYIEGNPDHPVNRGVLCAKGSAGIMHHYAPSRLTQPLKRVGPRGSNKFKEISWDEALETAVSWLDPIRKTDPKKLAFFTGRDQSQALTGWWATNFGTPNYAAHGGFCSVNMAAGGIYTMGGSFWEFGQPDWDHAKLFLLFGVAEDHDSNPIKTGMAKLKENGAKIVSINPIRTGYSAIADQWIGITPGTDGLFILSLAQSLLKAGKVDLEFLQLAANASWLVDDATGLIVRDDEGNPLAADRTSGKLVRHDDPKLEAALKGSFDHPGGSAKPVFELLANHLLEDKFSPEVVASQCGIEAKVITDLAAEIAEAAFEDTWTVEQAWTDHRGVKHRRVESRAVAVHAMRGISAHANGFQTCRSLHLLQLLVGAVDRPGSFVFKPPYPKAPEIHPKPAGGSSPETPLGGPPLGYTHGPEDLLINDDGSPQRIDKAFSWDAPLSAHGGMHMVIKNAHAGDPYKIDTLFMYMANMAWNSAMNSAGTIDMLTDKDPETGEYVIPHIIYSDAFSSEMVAYADLILPDTTYLERWDAISMLDRPISEPFSAVDSIRQPVEEPDRDVRPFQSVLLDIGARLGLKGMVNDDSSPKFPGGYSDYIVNHERAPGVGTLMGYRGADGAEAGKGAVNPKQLDRYIENGCFFELHLPDEMRYMRQVNQVYLDWAVEKGFLPKPMPVIANLYVETLQKFRTAPNLPATHRDRYEKCFNPLPDWYPPFEGSAVPEDVYPLHALTQRPMAMYHSWGSQNAWLRQLHGNNVLYISEAIAKDHGLETGDWAELASHHGAITVPVRVMKGVNEKTVWTWNAIGKRAGAWALDKNAKESQEGFLMNHLISELLPAQGGHRFANSDPVTGQAAWYDLRVNISKVDGAKKSLPQFDTLPLPKGVTKPKRNVAYGGDKS